MERNDEDSLNTSDQEGVGRSVARGLSALLLVALSVGLMVGLGVMVLTKVVGLGDDAKAGGEGSGTASLYMPEPEETDTVAPTPSVDRPTDPSSTPAELTLRATPRTVASMGKITLDGSYPAGAGSVLQVERRVGTEWGIFGDGISMTVRDDGSFSTWIQTGQAGPNVFRVTDQDKGLSSAPVTVTIG